MGAKKFLGQIDGAEFKFLGLETRFGRDSEFDRRNQISQSNLQKSNKKCQKLNCETENSYKILQNSKFLIRRNAVEMRLYTIDFDFQNQKFAPNSHLAELPKYFCREIFLQPRHSPCPHRHSSCRHLIQNQDFGRRKIWRKRRILTRK